MYSFCSVHPIGLWQTSKRFTSFTKRRLRPSASAAPAAVVRDTPVNYRPKKTCAPRPYPSGKSQRPKGRDTNKIGPAARRHLMCRRTTLGASALNRRCQTKCATVVSGPFRARFHGSFSWHGRGFFTVFPVSQLPRVIDGARGTGNGTTRDGDSDGSRGGRTLRYCRRRRRPYLLLTVYYYRPPPQREPKIIQ